MASVVNDDCAAVQVGGVVINSDLWSDQQRKGFGYGGQPASNRWAAGGRPAGGRRAAGRAASGLRRRPTAYGLPKNKCVPMGVHDDVNNSELE